MKLSRGRVIAGVIATVALICGSATSAWAAPSLPDSSPAAIQANNWPHSESFGAEAECLGFVAAKAFVGYRVVPYTIHPPAGMAVTHCIGHFSPRYFATWYT